MNGLNTLAVSFFYRAFSTSIAFYKNRNVFLGTASQTHIRRAAMRRREYQRKLGSVDGRWARKGKPLRLSSGIGRAVPLGALAGVGMIGMMAICPVVTERASATEAVLAAYMPSSIAITLDQDQLNTVVQPTKDGRFQAGSLNVNVRVSGATEYQVLVGGGGALEGIMTNVAGINSIQSGVSMAPTEMEKNTWGYAAAPGKDAEFGGETMYKAVPEGNTGVVSDVKTLGAAEQYSANDDYTISFGAKVDTSIPADTYRRTVNVSAVATPRLIASLEDAMTLQEVDSSICAGTVEGVSKRLMDLRDEKYYWVAKMRDGNCWMTQNLDFDIPEGGLDETLSLESDLPSGYVWDTSKATGSKLDLEGTDGTYYQPIATAKRLPALAEIDETATLSLDQGYYVNGTPSAAMGCGDQRFGIVGCSWNGLDFTEDGGVIKASVSAATANANKPQNDTTDYTEDVEISNNGVMQFLNISEDASFHGADVKFYAYPGVDFAADKRAGKIRTANLTTVAGTQNVNYPESNVVGIVDDNNPYINTTVRSAEGAEHQLKAGDYVFDAHYLTGNWYTFNAATAGTGGKLISVDSVGSVCPAGWRLPDIDVADATGTHKNFGGLWASYGWSVADGYNGTGPVSWQNNTESYDMALSPFYFGRNGRVYFFNSGSERNSLSFAGEVGQWWIGTAGSGAMEASNLLNSFRSTVGATQVRAVATGQYRSNGFNVRCVVR